MKQTQILLFAVVAWMAGCQPAAQHDMADNGKSAEDSVQEVFDKNSAAILAMLNGFVNENIDHAAFYADTVRVLETGFGVPQDTLNLDTLMANHAWMWATFDFEMVTDTLNVLPGVNPDTKRMDGSVRFYSSWKVTRPATESMPEKSGVIKLYESFDFNKDGKVVYQQIYGDFTGLFMYMNSN